ncbi:MAG TPA: hypothetical protein DCX54_09240 [Flavobacteriales bacterium]|nr:hypothetical protein [Flavobacteriales bacterium]
MLLLSNTLIYIGFDMKVILGGCCMNLKLIQFLVIASLLFSCAPMISTQTAEAPELNVVETVTVSPETAETLQITKFFSSLSDDVQNPERGFATDVDLRDKDYHQYYDEGYTLVYVDIRLDKYRNVDLPAKFLERMNSWFSSIRGSGVKAIVRFSYNDGPYPNPEPDAPLDMILYHIQQIRPILEKNSDVIAWMEAGFIGAWGEWHTSTNLLDRNINAKKKVLFSLLDALPADRMVLLRYPMDIMTIFPTPVSKGDAFSGSNQSRVGFHNDCFLSSIDDEHTYARRGAFTREQEFKYLSQMTAYVPVGGESCAYNPPRSDCESALSEISILHITELNDGWHPSVLDAWEEQGCFSEVQSRLGYRFLLTSVTFNNIEPPGGILNLEVSIRNDGFASMVNPRPIYIVLDGPVRYKVKLPEDPRFWAPGEESTFRAQLRIPVTAPAGEYRVAVWMPDAYESLMENPRYSVRFANTGIWDDENGFNVLATIDINPSAEGNVDSTAQEFKLLP